MPTSNLHSRSSIAALCLCAMVLAASPPAFAQSHWDAQEQADMWGRLQAQGLVKSPETVRAEAAKRRKPLAPTPLHEAERDDDAGVDARRRSSQSDAPRTPPTRDATAALPDA